MAKLKLTMKEVADLKAEMTEVQLSASRESSSLQAIIDDLNARIQAITDDFKLRLQDSENEAATAREEREHQRRKVLDLEGEVEKRDDAAAKAAKELLLWKKKIAKLNAEYVKGKEEIKQLTANVAEARKAAEEAHIALDLNQGTVETEEVLATLSEEKKITAKLTKQVQGLEAQLKAAKADATAKVEALTEKVRRMKLLLTKSKEVTQQREEELQKLLQTDNRADNFSIQAKIYLPLKEGSADLIGWCLIHEDSPKAPPAGSAAAAAAAKNASNKALSSGLRWVDEVSVNQWVAAGSTVLGQWPDSLQDQWQLEVDALRRSLELERDALKKEAEEVAQSFATYKARAQVALKRMGVEDRTERQRTATESQQNEQLQNTLSEMEAQLNDVCGLLDLEQAAKKAAVQELETKIALIEQLEAALESERAGADTDRASGGLHHISVAKAAASTHTGSTLATRSTESHEYETPNKRDRKTNRSGDSHEDDGDTDAGKDGANERTASSDQREQENEGNEVQESAMTSSKSPGKTVLLQKVRYQQSFN
jgi:chromosome segregation ATPase